MKVRSVSYGMRNFIQFIQYHNAVPIALSIMVLGAGGVFAATDPEALYSSSQKVVSIDNSYLVQKDLATYSPSIQIESVTEGSDTYDVAYRLTTIDVDDFVWKDVVRSEVMQVSKDDLGQYRDLGIYVTDIMKNIVARELQRLRETQQSERTNVSQKVIATEYGGLIGKFLDSTTEELPGYVPVVQPPVSESVPESVPPSLASPVEETGSGQAVVTPPPSTTAPVLKVFGNDPAEVPLGARYSDLGAIITSFPSNYGIHVFLDGVEVPQIDIDTKKTGEYTVTYKATDQDGNTGEASRRIHVYDPNAVVSTTSPAETP